VISTSERDSNLRSHTAKVANLLDQLARAPAIVEELIYDVPPELQAPAGVWRLVGS
jgi:hypothetical protein